MGTPAGSSLHNEDAVVQQEGKRGAEGRGAAVTIDIPMSDYQQFRLQRQSENASPVRTYQMTQKARRLVACSVPCAHLVRPWPS